MENDVEVVGYVNTPPNIPGMFRWIANVYHTDAKTARNIFFAGWPNLTESHFQDVISGKYTVDADGETVHFSD